MGNIKVSLTSDPVFKIFFKTNKKYLEYVIKEVTKLDIKEDTIEFLDTENHGEYADTKASRLDAATTEGLEKGMKQGLEQAKMDIALNMLKSNMDINKVSELTGLSVEDINKLK